jgi:AcrR family transcriptional regulator
MRQDELKRAAIRVFANRGYHAAKVSEIVGEAGVAQGTFYLYFASKQALFGEILSDFLGMLTRALSAWNVARIDTLERLRDDLRQIGHDLAEVMRNNADLTRIFFQEALAVDPEFNELIAHFYSQVIAVIRTVNQLCYERGLYRKMDFEVLAHCVVGMIERVVYQYVVVQAPDGRDAEAIIDEVIDLVLFGAAAAPADGPGGSSGPGASGGPGPGQVPAR